MCSKEEVEGQFVFSFLLRPLIGSEMTKVEVHVHQSYSSARSLTRDKGVRRHVM